MKKLTLKELTESQLQRVKVKLAQARKSLERPLTNAEQNRIKNEVIAEVMLQLEKEAAKARVEKKKQKYVPSQETFNWTASNHQKGRR